MNLYEGNNEHNNEFNNDRRSNNIMELDSHLITLIANIENMDKNIDTKLESVKDKIQNLDDKVSTRVDHIEKQINIHFDNESNTNKRLMDYDLKLSKSENYVERLESLENKYTILLKRVDELEILPTKNTAKIVIDFVSILKVAFYTALAGGIITYMGITISKFFGGSK